MGFLGDLSKGYDDFREGQLAKKKKNLDYLKRKAEIMSKEAKYKEQMNAARKSNLEGFNNRMDAFNGAIMGKGEKKKDKPGEGVDRWF